jgi:hypothetical protein
MHRDTYVTDDEQLRAFATQQVAVAAIEYLPG